MRRRNFLKLGSGAAIGGALAACGAHDPGPVAEQPAASGTVLGWNRLALQAIRTVQPGPPMAARSLAILHTCMYNAWAAYDDDARQTAHGVAVRLPRAERSAASKASAMSHAAYLALSDQFPALKPSFDAYMAGLGLDPAAPSGQLTPAGIGRTQTASMLDFCHRDGANQSGDLLPGGQPYADYTGYAPLNPPMVATEPAPPDGIPEPGRWQPLIFTDAGGVVRTQTYLGACWDRVAPFALSSASQFRPAAPAAAGSEAFAAQVQNIVEVQQKLTEQQKVIAEYWADGPGTELPPGHWCLLAQYVSERDRHDDDRDVRLFFALANALGDAATGCWDAKRAYDSARPVTAVRALLRGQTILGVGPLGPGGGLRQISGEAWLPWQPLSFPTPPFPDHISGHSSFSAAAAEVLRRFTGSDLLGTSVTKTAGSMHYAPNLPSADVTLRWPTFSAAAEEAGMSRVYGGIHFEAANTAGQQLGREVGALVFDKARRYWEGKL
jgi:hypothetical protein